MAGILIVDDLAANREVLVTLLRYLGHDLREAKDGEEALAAVRADRPDLVITDVLMPVMDGYELLRQLRLDAATASVPVIFYTAHYAEREARALAISGGVADVLTKPVEPEEVVRVVTRVLSGEQLRDRPEGALSSDFDREHLRLITDKLSQQTEDLRSANTRLRGLINVGLELASERDSDQLLRTVCTAARDLFGVTYVTLGIVDRDTDKVRRFVSYGVDVPAWIHEGDKIGGPLGTVVRERRSVGNSGNGTPDVLWDSPPHPPARMFLAAPVVSPVHTYGWLCLVDNDGRAFTSDDEQLVRALSGQVGRIYENGYFYAIAQKRAEELEREVIERKQVAAALQAERNAVRTAEARMRFALESANVGIWDMDYSSGALRWSETLEAHYGVPAGTFEGTFDAFIERIHPDDRATTIAIIEDALKTGSDFRMEHRSVWPDGTVHWLNGAGRAVLGPDGQPFRAVGISLDVTERHALEAQYHQAQKMEAVGRLAGGVAHDFNNLLTAILGYCELLLVELDETDPRGADVLEIQKAGIRAAGLTRQLLAFSRKQIIEPTFLDLNEVILDVEKMLDRLIGEDVSIELGLDSASKPIRADRGQVEQVILNLAVNARDAMPTGGQLMIETANVEIDGTYANPYFAVTPGPYVVLTVTDTGSGMPPEVQQRLFEPFFTTKEPGKGTGLGLATVHGIVARCGGSVQVRSELGQGTSFDVYFPMVEGTDEGALRTTPPEPVLGTPTVLVVEDSSALRALSTRLLQRLGYAVLVASNISEGLNLFESHGPSIDVVLTDVVMPGGSGPELIGQLVMEKPDLKVIYMSGYTEDTIVHHGVLNPGIAFLNKPFTSETLGRKIREVLASH